MMYNMDTTVFDFLLDGQPANWSYSIAVYRKVGTRVDFDYLDTFLVSTLGRL
jgi:hypothetical protein